MRISDWSSDVCSSDLELMIVDHIGAADRGDDSLREAFGVARRGNIVEHDGEFVAAEPPACHPALHQPLEPRRDLREQFVADGVPQCIIDRLRSEEHTSELQSLMRISYAVFCLKKKKYTKTPQHP